VPNNSKKKKRNTGIKRDPSLANAMQTRSYTERGMYSSVIIEGFRLFDHLELDNLARVNLFFGPNNSGKTSILEAIFTHACGLNLGPFQNQIVPRRQSSPLTGPLDIGERLISLFRETSLPPYTFTISAKVAGDSSTYTVTSRFRPSSELSDLDPRMLGQFSKDFPSKPYTDTQFSVNELQLFGQQARMRSVQIPSVFLGKWETQLNRETSELDLHFPQVSTLSVPPFKLASIHDILAHRSPESDIRVFSHLKRYGILPEFTKEMEKAFPEIREIDMIPYPDGTQGSVYVAVSDGRRIPIYAFGDGMRRWFYLLGQMLVYKYAAHCIEEIDSTFHPSVQGDISRLLLRYAEQFDNQLFLTSHSIEFADAFLESLYGEDGVVAPDEDPVRIFTIKPSEDTHRLDVWVLTGREAYEKRRSYELELR
jgi:hypothetical protein